VPIKPGDTLRGKYVVFSSIGRGGMGEVFAARRVRDSLDVAIKVVSRTVVDDTLMSRLEREAIAARRIKSAFVPELFEVDRTDDGELFLVMRLLSGVTLPHRLRERGVLPWDEVRTLVDDVLSGLCDAHAAGVVHRDLKPGNIFLEHIEAPTVPSGQPMVPATADVLVGTREFARILDFGVCKLDASDHEKLTMTGETVGTVSYMAPEQIRGASEVDGRADLYALATLAFEAVSGRIPFDAEGQMALLAQKLEARPRRLRGYARVPVPADLDAVLDKALSRKADDRYATADEMRRAWRALGPPVASEPNVLPIVTQTGINYPTETGVTAATATRPPSLGSRIGLAIALATVVIAAGALFLTLHHRAEAPSASASTEAADPPPPVTGPTSTVQTISVPMVELTDDIDAGARRRPLPIHRPPTTRTVPTASQQGPHITTVPRY
jgi:serine/threonine protein kinase